MLTRFCSACTDREGETIAEILQAYRALVLISTERINNKASIGQAAHNSMAMQLETQRLVCPTLPPPPPYIPLHRLKKYPLLYLSSDQGCREPSCPDPSGT